MKKLTLVSRFFCGFFPIVVLFGFFAKLFPEISGLLTEKTVDAALGTKKIKQNTSSLFDIAPLHDRQRYLWLFFCCCNFGFFAKWYPKKFQATHTEMKKGRHQVSRNNLAKMLKATEKTRHERQQKFMAVLFPPVCYVNYFRFPLFLVIFLWVETK